MNNPLPSVLLKVSGDTAEASAAAGKWPGWKIYAELDRYPDTRVQVYLSGDFVADITVHPLWHESPIDGAQAVASALLWSALRAWRRDQVQGWLKEVRSD